MRDRLHVAGRPTGTMAWREAVAAAARGWRAGAAVQMDFVIPPRRWVDVDTLAQTTLAGLRDAGALAPRYAGLDAFVATKDHGERTGVVIARRTQPAPDGPAVLDATTPVVPRAGDRAAKRAWRDTLARCWRDRPPLEGRVWADVSLPVAGALPARVEVVLDALEPVLGRDPRGRQWQEFFPNDDRITWLRVARARDGAPLRLRVGGLS